MTEYDDWIGIFSHKKTWIDYMVPEYFTAKEHLRLQNDLALVANFWECG